MHSDLSSSIFKNDFAFILILLYEYKIYIYYLLYLLELFLLPDEIKFLIG